MFGAVMDAMMSIPKNMHDEEMQNDAQNFAHDEARWSRAFNEGEAQKSRDFNSAQAVVQRDWSERMSNTQYQRAATDANAAGLNRILAMRQGGAGNPAGATATGAGAVSSAANSGISNTGGTTSRFQEAQMNSAQIANLREDTVKKTQEGYGVSARTELDKQQTNLVMQQQDTQRAITEQARHQASILSNTAKGHSLEGEIDETTYGKIMRYINRSVRSITGGASAYQHTIK